MVMPQPGHRGGWSTRLQRGWQGYEVSLFGCVNDILDFRAKNHANSETVAKMVKIMVTIQ